MVASSCIVTGDGLRQLKRPFPFITAGESKKACCPAVLFKDTVYEVARGKTSDLDGSSDHEGSSDIEEFSGRSEADATGTANLGLKIEQVHGKPPAWAENRADFCSGALPFFRACQGALYQKDGICYGFLLSGDGGERTHIDEEVVITRVGGDCKKLDDGRISLKADQDQNGHRVRALRQAMGNGLVVLVVGGHKHPLDLELPHCFNVMDLFRVTHVWEEKVDGYVGFKVRFEKHDLSQKSWWAKKGSPLPPPLDERDFELKPQSIECKDCREESPWVYSEGWMCLRRECGKFCKINNEDAPASRTFHPDFLRCRSRPDQSLKHPLALSSNATAKALTGMNTFSQDAWRGIVCEECSQCIPRTRWGSWECPCGFKLKIASPTIDIQSVCLEKELQIRTEDRKPKPPHRKVLCEIDDVALSPYRTVTYKLGSIGLVTHIMAGCNTNGRPGGPNDMFRELQECELGLERRKLNQSVVNGTLTAHFSVNYGMPYKFIVSVADHAFDAAPDVALRGLGRLTWATEKAAMGMGDHFHQPNELLVLAYLDKMHIGYHDDGEDTLGPTIATLSLGASATMKIRMKPKYYYGPAKKGQVLEEEDPLLPGCIAEKERRTLKEQFQAGSINRAQYNALRLQTRKEFLNLKSTPKAPPPIIEMEVAHGDMVVMHGAEFQKYYEHAVDPKGKLRFALTARYVKPEMVSSDKRPLGQFALTPDQMYHGD